MPAACGVIPARVQRIIANVSCGTCTRYARCNRRQAIDGQRKGQHQRRLQNDRELFREPSFRKVVLVAALIPGSHAMRLIITQPLHGITFELLHLACMRLLAVTVPAHLANGASYGTVGFGAATVLLTLVPAGFTKGWGRQSSRS
jgi:hypothetical protein